MNLTLDNKAKITAGSLFLVPALLLSTPNFSVAIIIITIAASFFFIFTDWKSYTLSPFDILVVFIFSSYAIVNIPVAISDGTTLRYFQGGSRLLLCLPIYFFFSWVFRKYSSNPFEYYLSLGVIWGSVLALLLALYQYFYLGLSRAEGFLFSINFGYLSCSLLFLSFCLLRKPSNLKTWLYISFISALVATIFSFTRGAIFAIPILFVFCIIMEYRKMKFQSIVIGVLVTLITCASFYKLSTGFKQRVNFTLFELTSIARGEINEAKSAGDRIQYWIGAVEAFKKSPIIGLTYDSRERLNHQLYLQGVITERASKLNRGHAHNQYFEMLASNGVLGILGFSLLIFSPLVICICHYKTTKSNLSYTGATFIVGFSIYSLTEVPLQANLISAYYGFMLAFFLAHIRADNQAGNMS